MEVGVTVNGYILEVRLKWEKINNIKNRVGELNRSMKLRLKIELKGIVNDKDRKNGRNRSEKRGIEL